MPEPIFLRSTRRVCDFIPSRKCQDTLYMPFLLRDPSPVIPGRHEVLYTMGGHTDAPQTPPPDPVTGQQTDPMTWPGRFVDKIYYSHREANGAWTSAELLIAKSFFPWMNDEAFLQAHPESFIGSVAAPNVLKINGSYHMLFAASVSDPNCCTGEHNGGNVHGSCSEPWSFFALFWATSPDGRNWTLQNMGRQHTNVALQHAAIFHEPTKQDIKNGAFKGISAASALVDGDHVYISFEFWSTNGLKSGLLRAPADSLGAFEIWGGWQAGKWLALEDGRLPRWFNDEKDRGPVFSHIPNQITHTSLFPGKRFLLTAQSSTNGRRNNCIEVAMTDDLTNWAGEQIVQSSIGTLNGTGDHESVLNPIYCEDGNGGFYFLFATNDDDQDGVHDCNNGPYPGLAIYRADSTPQSQPNFQNMPVTAAVLPVVGSAQGASAFFRTGVQAHNAGSESISGKFVFHRQGTTGTPTDPSLPYTLAPGETIDHVDLLPAMGLSGLGSLDIVTNDRPPLMVARVFSDKGDAGTAGFTFEPVATSAALHAGDSAVLIAPSDPAKTTFNIGVRSLDAGASFSITVRGRNGTPKGGAVTKTYAQNFFEQVRSDFYLGIPLEGSDTITFSVSSGETIIYGTSTDNKTQDSSLSYARKM